MYEKGFFSEYLTPAWAAKFITLLNEFFLKRFVNDEVNWAHLDIAGVAWINKDLPLSKKGGTGFGIRLINDYISNNFERK